MSANRIAVVLGALLGLGVIVLGATQNHDMHAKFSLADIRSYDTAIRYQMFQAIALLALGALAHTLGSKLTRWVVYLWALGCVLFCGSIYLRVNAGVDGIGLLTPIGGALMILGWALMLLIGVLFVLRKPDTDSSSDSP